MQSDRERPIRVLAAEDSAVMRGILRTVLAGSEETRNGGRPMEMCEVAQDGVECLEAVLRLRPDVLLLDLEMPRMHGLGVLERLRAIEPGLPVIMCSAYTERGARSTLDALALGAADYVTKPSGQGNFSLALESLSGQLLPKIAALAALAAGRERREGQTDCQAEMARTAAASVQSAKGARLRREEAARVEVVVIGVSTGGPSALEQMLPRLPANFPVPVLIVQHMPKLFTGALAERLDRCCALRVKQAYEGAVVVPGTIWLAPGDAHMEVARMGSAVAGGRYVIRLHHEAPLHSCKPAVDYLFRSAAKTYGAGALALVMTGMGADGVEGARAVHRAGGAVLAQDQATSAVWGMPGRVTQAGIAGTPLPLSALAAELVCRVGMARPGRGGANSISGRTAFGIREREAAIGLL